MKRQQTKQYNRTFGQYAKYLEMALHIICWAIFFLFPLLMLDRNTTTFTWSSYLKHLTVPIAFMIVFYINYFLLIPKLLFKNKAYTFIIYNILLVIAMSLLLHFFHELTMTKMIPEALPEGVRGGGPNRVPESLRRPHPPRARWAFFFRDFIGFAFTVGIAAIIRITKRWSKIEDERKEAERTRTEVELKNLQNQLNPHFLLNTLNNIYALTAFDPEKAQEAIQELSKLLRYMLYENQAEYVSLGKEADFIRNYIELMHIRLASNITLEANIDISPDNKVQITPLLFISLVENAFKHGISSEQKSYIKITLSENYGIVTCDIRNSNFPKTDRDKSGSGIGLVQVSKRLELVYPNNYKWERGITENGKEYYSILTIDTRYDPELRNSR